MEAIGSVGVAILLGAFFANLVGWLDTHSRVYHGLNAVGAAIAAYASYGIGFAPFVVLEAVWCLVALVALARIPSRGGRARSASTREGGASAL
jgi:hypothetical protein